MAAAQADKSSLSREKLIVRSFILYEYRLGSSEDAAAARINQLMGEGLVSASVLRPWFSRFNSGDYSLEEEEEEEDSPQEQRQKKQESAPLTNLLRLPFPSMYIPPTVRTSTVHLNQIDDLLLKQIVKKFTFRSGVNFYRSCRGAKRVVDDSKPLWPISSMDYSLGSPILSMAYGGSNKKFTNYSVEKFCKVNRASVLSNNDMLIRRAAVPELESFGAVGTLTIASPGISEEVIRLLLTAAKPDTLQIPAKFYDFTSDTFESVKNLDVSCFGLDVESFWTTKRIFQLARNRKTLTFYFKDFHMEIIANFIENWRKGESTSSLEKLTLLNPAAQDAVANAKKLLEVGKCGSRLMPAPNLPRYHDEG